MRINLHCPYSEKEEVKSLGARWDSFEKTWYIVNHINLYKFAKWIPKEVMDFHLDAIARRKNKPKKFAKGNKKISKMLDSLEIHWRSI